MKALLWFGCLALSAAGAFGQRGRIVFQESAPPHPAGAPARAVPRPAARHRPFAPIFPLGFGGYYGGGYYDQGYAPALPPPPVVIAPPPVVNVVPPQPPETATMVIHEYAPSSAGAVPPAGEAPLFGIVLRDGSLLSASAVVAQDNALHIVDADGGHQRVPMDRVDRAATVRVNRERNLQLQLPPPRY